MVREGGVVVVVVVVVGGEEGVDVQLHHADDDDDDDGSAVTLQCLVTKDESILTVVMGTEPDSEIGVVPRTCLLLSSVWLIPYFLS